MAGFSYLEIRTWDAETVVEGEGFEQYRDNTHSAGVDFACSFLSEQYSIVDPYLVFTKDGKIGLRTDEPGTVLDVDGDFALRWKAGSLDAGANHNVVVGESSRMRLSGLSADAEITGLSDGYEGKELIIHNLTAFVITLLHEDTNSTAENRINTHSTNDVIIPGPCFIHLHYDGILDRWVFDRASAVLASDLEDALLTSPSFAGRNRARAQGDYAALELQMFDDAQLNAIFRILDEAGTTAIAGFSNTARLALGLDPNNANSTLDIVGSQAIREQDVTVANGQNDDLNIGRYSHINLIGASAAVTITGLSNGNDASGRNGWLVTLVNDTGQVVTIKHQDTGSTTYNRIITKAAADIVLADGGVATFVFSSARDRFLHKETAGGTDGSSSSSSSGAGEKMYKHQQFW